MLAEFVPLRAWRALRELALSSLYLYRCLTTLVENETPLDVVDKIPMNA